MEEPSAHASPVVRGTRASHLGVVLPAQAHGSSILRGRPWLPRVAETEGNTGLPGRVGPLREEEEERDIYRTGYCPAFVGLP